MSPDSQARPPQALPPQALTEVRLAWQRYLESVLAEPVELSFGRARRTPVLMRRREGRLSLRMHAMFAEAPDEVRWAVGRWLAVGRRARRACLLLDRWIATALEELPPAERGCEPRPCGEHRHLTPMRDELIATQFASAFGPPEGPPSISWGRRGRTRPRYSMRLGSYYPSERLIRIHPVLDQPAVPEWFLRFVVFHELLHAALPPQREPGRRWVHHGPEFRRRERHYPDYQRALAWEQDNLGKLIRCARSGVPLRVPRVAKEKVPAASADARPRSSSSARSACSQGELFT